MKSWAREGPKCNKLELMVIEPAAELNAEGSIAKVFDVNEIAQAGVMLKPALMVNGDVKVAGKLPSKDELSGIIKAGL